MTKKYKKVTTLLEVGLFLKAGTLEYSHSDAINKEAYYQLPIGDHRSGWVPTKNNTIVSWTRETCKNLLTDPPLLFRVRIKSDD